MLTLWLQLEIPTPLHLLPGVADWAPTLQTTGASHTPQGCIILFIIHFQLQLSKLLKKRILRMWNNIVP